MKERDVSSGVAIGFAGCARCRAQNLPDVVFQVSLKLTVGLRINLEIHSLTYENRTSSIRRPMQLAVNFNH